MSSMPSSSAPPPPTGHTDQMDLRVQGWGWWRCHHGGGRRPDAGGGAEADGTFASISAQPWQSASSPGMRLLLFAQRPQPARGVHHMPRRLRSKRRLVESMAGASAWPSLPGGGRGRGGRRRGGPVGGRTGTGRSGWMKDRDRDGEIWTKEEGRGRGRGWAVGGRMGTGLIEGRTRMGGPVGGG